MEIKIGDILFAKWLVPQSELDPVILGRHVIVTAMDQESITVRPVEPEQVSQFRYGDHGHPVARKAEGTMVVLLPCSADGLTVHNLDEVGA